MVLIIRRIEYLIQHVIAARNQRTGDQPQNDVTDCKKRSDSAAYRAECHNTPRQDEKILGGMIQTGYRAPPASTSQDAHRLNVEVLETAAR